MANSTTLTGVILQRDAPESPMVCRISGYLKSPQGLPLPGGHVTFEYLSSPLGLGTGTLIQQSRVSIRADRHGYVEFDLLRGGRFTAELMGQGTHIFKKVVVPDAPSADLIDFIFPYIVSVTFEDPDPALLTVGQKLQVRVVGALSNGESIVLPSSAVTIDNSNTSALAPFETVWFRGQAPGVAELSISAVDRSAASTHLDVQGDPLSFFQLPPVTLPEDPKVVEVV